VDKAGGKAKFLLTGLLVCDKCTGHYTIVNATHYGCAATADGACDNTIRVRRDHAEDFFLTPIRTGLLSTERIAMMQGDAALLLRTNEGGTGKGD
jgi:site-specific DNA recombinase